MRVVLLADSPMQVGLLTVEFDASSLTSGVYLYQLTTQGEIRTRKMMLIKLVKSTLEFEKALRNHDQ